MEGDFVYRISVAKEWEDLRSNGSTFGGDLDKSSGIIHLSKLDQVRPTLENFFSNCKEELYLLQIDVKKLGDGLIYEIVDGSNSFPHFYGPSRSFSPLPLDALGDGLIYEIVDGSNSFPHFYGPSRSFSPLPLDAVTKAEKLSLSDSRFSCSMID